MFRHILIPTDGSELAEKAICYGVELAKEQAAKITAVVVTRPFLIVTLEPGMLAGTPATYAKHVAERTRKYLDVAAQAAEAKPERQDTHAQQNPRACISLKAMRSRTFAWTCRLGTFFSLRQAKIALHSIA